MIDIEIIGSKSKTKNFLYEESIKYYLSILLPRHKNLLIDLTIDKNANHSIDGFCDIVAPKYLAIEIAGHIPFEQQLKTLAHETVHCKQYIKKELKNEGSFLVWKKHAYKNKMQESSVFYDYDEYMNTPWEKEAFALESELFESFKTIYDKKIEAITNREHKRLIKTLGFINS